jgi:hypothetical protein
VGSGCCVSGGGRVYRRGNRAKRPRPVRGQAVVEVAGGQVCKGADRPLITVSRSDGLEEVCDEDSCHLEGREGEGRGETRG